MLDETVAKHAKVLIDFTVPGNCRYDDDNVLGALSFFIDWTLRHEQHDNCDDTPTELHGPHPSSASSSISGTTTTTAFANAVLTSTPPLSYAAQTSSLSPWMNALVQSGVVAAVAKLLTGRAAAQGTRTGAVWPPSSPTTSQTRCGGVAVRDITLAASATGCAVSREIQSEALEFCGCLVEGRVGGCLAELLDTSGLLVALLARLDAECEEEEQEDEDEVQSPCEDEAEKEACEGMDGHEEQTCLSSACAGAARRSSQAKATHSRRVDVSDTNASSSSSFAAASYMPALHFKMRLLLILQDIFRALSGATLVGRFGFIASPRLMRSLLRLALLHSRHTMPVTCKRAALQRQLGVQALRLLQLLCTRHMTWLQHTDETMQATQKSVTGAPSHNAPPRQDTWQCVEQTLLCLLREGIVLQQQQCTQDTSTEGDMPASFSLQSVRAEVMMQALQTIQGMLIGRARRSSSRTPAELGAASNASGNAGTALACMPWAPRRARDALVRVIAQLLRCQPMPGEDSGALCGVQTEALRVLQALVLALTEQQARQADTSTGEELMGWVCATPLLQSCVLRLRSTTRLLRSIAAYTSSSSSSATIMTQESNNTHANTAGGSCRREVDVALRVARFVYILHARLSCEGGEASQAEGPCGTHTMDVMHAAFLQCQLPSSLAGFVAAMYEAGQFALCEPLGVLDMVAPSHDVGLASIAHEYTGVSPPQSALPQPSTSSSSSSSALLSAHNSARRNAAPRVSAVRESALSEDAMTRLLFLPVHDAMQFLHVLLSQLQSSAWLRKCNARTSRQDRCALYASQGNKEGSEHDMAEAMRRECAVCCALLTPYVTAFLASCIGVSERGCLPSSVLARLVAGMCVLRLSWAMCAAGHTYMSHDAPKTVTQCAALRPLLLRVAGEQGGRRMAHTEGEQRCVTQAALDLMHTIVVHSKKSEQDSSEDDDDDDDVWQEVEAMDELLRWHCVPCLPSAEQVTVQHMSALWKAQHTSHGWREANPSRSDGTHEGTRQWQAERLVHDLCACAVPFAHMTTLSRSSSSNDDNVQYSQTWQDACSGDSNKRAAERSVCDMTACETGLLACGGSLPRVLRLLHALLRRHPHHQSRAPSAYRSWAAVRVRWFMSGAGCLLCAVVHHCSAWLVQSACERDCADVNSVGEDARSRGYTSAASQEHVLRLHDDLLQRLLRLPDTPFASYDGAGNGHGHAQSTPYSSRTEAEHDASDTTYCVAWLFATSVRLLALLLQPAQTDTTSYTRSMYLSAHDESNNIRMSSKDMRGMEIEACARETWHGASRAYYNEGHNEEDEGMLVCARELTRCWLRNTPWLPLEDSLLVKRCRADEAAELRRAVSFVRELVAP